MNVKRPTPSREFVRIKLREYGPIEIFHNPLEELAPGSVCVVCFDRGHDYGHVLEFVPKPAEPLAERQRVIRLCQQRDFDRIAQNRTEAQTKLAPCREAIQAHALPMKLITAEYTFDRAKLVFYFGAEERVDFRELVRDLHKLFRVRIELRQVGVRDETRMLGGIACCGRITCCRSWLPEFTPVNIRMAKLQQMQLHPAKLSGVCGRLKCCLAYEDEAYRELQAKLPQKGQRVRTPDGPGDVAEVHLLRQLVTVRFEDDSTRVYPASEVTVVSRSRTRAKARARKRRLASERTSGSEAVAPISPPVESSDDQAS